MILSPAPWIPASCLMIIPPFPSLPFLRRREIPWRIWVASKAKSIDTNNWGFPKAKHCLCTIIKTHQASWSLFRACPSNVNTQPRIFRYLTKVFHTKRQRHPPSSIKKKKKMKLGNKDSIGIRSIETQIPVLSPEWYYIYENQHVFLGKSFFF